MIARIAASAALACCLFAPPAAQAQGVKLVKEFKGSAPGDRLEKTVGRTSYFPTADAFKKFWEATGTKDPLPKVNFDKELVLRVYAREVKDLSMQLKLSAKGDLSVGQTSKPGDKVEVMSYHVVVVSRDGIKTVDGRAVK